MFPWLRVLALWWSPYGQIVECITNVGDNVVHYFNVYYYILIQHCEINDLQVVEQKLRSYIEEKSGEGVINICFLEQLLLVIN